MRGGGQTDGEHPVVQLHLLLQLHQRYVVGEGQGVVSLVTDDAFDAPLLRPLIGQSLGVEAQEGLP